MHRSTDILFGHQYLNQFLKSIVVEMKVKVNRWHATAVWKWEIEEDVSLL